jgi:hypothetical protein
MLRFTSLMSLIGALLLTASSSAFADGSFTLPGQAMVRINPSGQLEMVSRVSRPVTMQKQRTEMVKEIREETRNQTVKVLKDGRETEETVPVKVNVETMVPKTVTYLETQFVIETKIHTFPASTNAFRREADKAEVPLFDLAGNRLTVTAVADRLRDWTLVVISKTGKPLDRKYAGIFKPTTIVIGVPPQAISMPTYVPAPTQESAPAPAGAPEFKAIAFLADEAPPQLPNGPEPTFAIAKVWGDKTVALRTEEEKTLEMTSMVAREEERMREGKAYKVTVAVPQQIQKTIEIRETVKYPTNQVSVTRIPNKSVTTGELASILAVETLAMVSADGKPVDPFWQRNLRDGTLVIVAPTAAPSTAAPMAPPATP